MRVDSNRPVRNAAPRRGSKAVSGTERGFSDLLAHEAAPAAPAAPAAGVGGLLALQELGDATAERRRAAMARGFDLLDRLDELRVGLLTGTLDRGMLTSIAQRVRTARSAVDDPGLAAVLDEIELRTAVELAKLGETP